MRARSASRFRRFAAALSAAACFAILALWGLSAFYIIQLSNHLGPWPPVPGSTIEGWAVNVHRGRIAWVAIAIPPNPFASSDPRTDWTHWYIVRSVKPGLDWNFEYIPPDGSPAVRAGTTTRAIVMPVPSMPQWLVPLWLPALCFATLTLWLWWPFLRRIPRGHCPHCFYDLRSLPPNSPCPECGRARPA